MADAADTSCVHPYGLLTDDPALAEVRWECGDCGRPFATITHEAIQRGMLPVWAARHDIPPRKVRASLPALEATVG